MNQDLEALEHLWDNLLSRNPEQILKIFSTLDEVQQKSVLDHLNRMAQEPGWHPEQCLSAQVALKALANWSELK